MKQTLSGFILWFLLILPPVAHFFESVMIIHMHMQMPLLVIAGFFIAKYFLTRYHSFFNTWNETGVPGILLFTIISIYWMIPRTMDEALMSQLVEWFKFISLPFLAGVPLRDSWSRLTSGWKNSVLISFTVLFLVAGLLYIYAPVQLCNNYLLIEQITLGWGFLLTAICLAIYLIYDTIRDPSAYE